MDVSHILDNLNDEQRNAVTSKKQHLLVLAGQGLPHIHHIQIFREPLPK